MNYKDFITALADTSYADWYVDVGGELRIACDEDPTADAEDPIAAVCNDMLGTDYNSRNAWFWAARELGLSAKDVEAICDAADGKRGEVRDDMLEALGLGGSGHELLRLYRAAGRS